MNAAIFLPMLLCAVIAAGLHFYGRLRRVVAIMIICVALLAVAGIAAWRDALAALITTQRAFDAFLAIAVVSAIAVYHEVIKCHMHHHVRTPVCGAIFGTSLILAIGEGKRLLRQVRRTPASTGRALSSAIRQMRSGHAAAAGHGHSMMPLLVGGVIVVGLIVVLRRYRRPAPGGGAPWGRMTSALPGARAPQAELIGSVSPARALGAAPARPGGRKKRPR